MKLFTDRLMNLWSYASPAEDNIETVCRFPNNINKSFSILTFHQKVDFDFVMCILANSRAYPDNHKQKLKTPIGNF